MSTPTPADFYWPVVDFDDKIAAGMERGLWPITPWGAHGNRILEEKFRRWRAEKERRRVQSEHQSTVRTSTPASATPLNLADWTAARFVGDAPPVDYLIGNSFAMGEAGMVAAMGDTGKSFALLELARRVAFGDGGDMLARPLLGGTVQRRGTAVFITSEDSAGSVHRRLAALDADNDRAGVLADKLRIVPLSSAGGPFALWREDRKDGLTVTDDFCRLRDQLIEIDDLCMVALDPLSSFAHLPINENPVAGQFVCTSLANLAEETGAAVLLAHHMRKSLKPIESLADARDAVRGTTALVDGLRLAYGLWPADAEQARSVCAQLGVRYEHGIVVKGGIMKGNGPVRRGMATYVRSKSGLLVDRTADLGTSPADREGMMLTLIDVIAGAAARGQPFTKTGKAGLHDQKHRLPPDLATISRSRMIDMVDEALAAGELVACVGRGSSIAKWLDVPAGKFALGLGEFRRGAEPSA